MSRRKKLKHDPNAIVLARCDHCHEPYHETLASQWLDGNRPQCGFCGLQLTQDKTAQRDETIYSGIDAPTTSKVFKGTSEDWKFTTLSVEFVLATTDKAILCYIDGDEVWVPRSQIRGDSEGLEKDDSDVELQVTKWWFKTARLK